MRKSLVLLSGGLDSTINLYEAKRVSDVVLALTFNYGQRAQTRELEHAGAIAKRVGVPHRVVELPWFKDFTNTSLVSTSREVPVGQEISIDDLKTSQTSAKAVWVPNRNGILLNVAAGFAEGLGADWIVPGFNIEEAATFPDNSEDFLRSLTHSLSFSTANAVEVKCFTTQMNKSEIVRRGIELGVDFEMIWPCYFGGQTPCGTCESCQRFKRATRAADLEVKW
jgi:7-cyano-7-deazaguanine synthase